MPSRKVFGRVVAAGGDGTVNHVANGIAGSKAALGIAPHGNGQRFRDGARSARERSRALLGNCPGRKRAVSLIYRARTENTSSNSVELGSMRKPLKKPLLRSSAVLARSVSYSAAHIAARQPPQLLIESEDAPVREGSFVLVGNGRLYGGPFPFFKQAVVDDGLLDVVVFKRLGFLEIIKYLHDVVFSSDIRVPEIEYFQTRQLRVSSEQDVPVELDGELAGNCPVDFQMHEKALPVLSPAASP